MLELFEEEISARNAPGIHFGRSGENWQDEGCDGSSEDGDLHLLVEGIQK